MKYIFKINLFLLFSLWLLLFSVAAIMIPVYEVSEAREGVVIQQILRTNNWVLPLRQELIIPSKPILFHWFGAVFFKYINMPNEFLLRLPSILSAALLLIPYFIFCKRYLEPSFTLISTMMLASTFGYFQLAIDGRVDMMFTFFACSAIFVWLQAALDVYNQKLYPDKIPEKIYFISSILCGFAFLTKGPLGLLFPAMVIGLSALYLWGVKKIFNLIRPSLLLGIIIPGIWYFLAWLQGGDAFLAKHLFFENINRFSGGQGITSKPWWFYLQHFWGMTLPWCLFLFVPKLLNKKVYIEQKVIIDLLCIWAFFFMFVLSLSSGKRSAYLLAILPPLILCLSIFLQEYFNKKKYNPTIKKIYVFSFIPLALFVLIFLINKMVLLNNFSSRVMLSANANFLRFQNLGIYLIIYLIILGLISVNLLKYFKEKNTYLVWTILLLNIQFSAALVPYFISVKAITHGISGLSEVAKKVIPEREKLIAIKTFEDESLDTFFYLYNRETTILKPENLEQIKPGYYIASYSQFNALQETVSKLGKVIYRLGIGKKPKDDDGMSFVIFQVS